MKTPPSPHRFPTRDAWRDWLQEQHASQSEAWLVIRKKNAAATGLTYLEAVEQALCFGWIDGVMVSVDAESYFLRFSPRQPGSLWSAANRKRAERLIVQGQMTAAGLAKVEEARENGQWEAAFRREDTSILPEELRAALQEQAGGQAGFESLPASRKQMLIHWVVSTKTEKTRQKRIQEVVKIACMKKGSRMDSVKELDADVRGPVPEGVKRG